MAKTFQKAKPVEEWVVMNEKDRFLVYNSHKDYQIDRHWQSYFYWVKRVSRATKFPNQHSATNAQFLYKLYSSDTSTVVMRLK